MRVADFFQLFLLQGRSASRVPVLPVFTLTIVCAQSALTSLRKQVTLELQSRGLSASRIVSTPASHDAPACLAVVLNCGKQGLKACNELALHVGQLPEVEHIHWGRSHFPPH